MQLFSADPTIVLKFFKMFVATAKSFFPYCPDCPNGVKSMYYVIMFWGFLKTPKITIFGREGISLVFFLDHFLLSILGQKW